MRKEFKGKSLRKSYAVSVKKKKPANPITAFFTNGFGAFGKDHLKRSLRAWIKIKPSVNLFIKGKWIRVGKFFQKWPKAMGRIKTAGIWLTVLLIGLEIIFIAFGKKPNKGKRIITALCKTAGGLLGVTLLGKVGVEAGEAITSVLMVPTFSGAVIGGFMGAGIGGVLGALGGEKFSSFVFKERKKATYYFRKYVAGILWKPSGNVDEA
jgi:hypothetical protein